MGMELPESPRLMKETIVNQTTRFNLRAFATLGVLFSGLGLPVTGIANHVYQFESLSTVRHAWMAAHNSLGLLFVVFCIWHVALNRKALLNHIRAFAVRVPMMSREAIAAVAVVALVLFLFVSHAFHGQ